MPETSDTSTGAANVAARTPTRPLPDPSSRMLIPRIAATLMPVLQFWTFALWRVPRTFTAPTPAIIRAGARFAAVGPGATNCRRDSADGTARVATHPAESQKNQGLTRRRAG